jgi:hypothetical protein
MEPALPGFEGFPELSFQDKEHGFDFVSLMVFFYPQDLNRCKRGAVSNRPAQQPMQHQQRPGHRDSEGLP